MKHGFETLPWRLNPGRKAGVLSLLKRTSGALAAFMALALPQGAKGGSIIETIGVSVMVGTVLGASTLPFYETPGDHLGNIYLGAAAGAGVGLGILIYGWIAGDDDDDRKAAHRGAHGFSPSSDLSFRAERGANPFRPPMAAIPSDTRYWMPVVSLTL